MSNETFNHPTLSWEEWESGLFPSLIDLHEDQASSL